MNPPHWKREHQIAFAFAALIGAFVGISIGLREFEAHTSNYWLHVGSWGVLGAFLGAAGGFLRQLLRGRKSN